MHPKAHETFLAEMTKLRANFGSNNFSDEKIQLIWTLLKDLSPAEVKKVCALVLSECEYTPVFAHFKKFSMQVRDSGRLYTSKTLTEPEDGEAVTDPQKIRAFVAGALGRL